MNSSLNHVYRIVWNATLGLWQVASEATRGRGKTGSSQQARKARRALVAASALALTSPAAWAVLPTGGVVVAGQASIQQAGNALNIVQGTDKAAIDWQSFSIGQGNSVNFVQPSATSVALNRVLGNDVSVIQGAINANGQVFLVNQNGVLFTPTAQVNVGGIVASTQNISTADFMAGKYEFSGNSTATVENQGSITTANGGVVALVAAKVINSGTITAPQGTVGLAAGNTVVLDLGGPVKIQVTEGALNAAIEQSGGIRADGGTIYLTAKAAGNLAASVINHSGVTRALTMASLTGEPQGQTGSIALSADQINHTGTLDVSGLLAGQHGGDILAQGKHYSDSGTTLADGAAQGGNIDVRATHITQTQGAKVSASSSDGQGGRIEMIGDLGNGRAEFAGQILATGRRRGGFVDTSGAKLLIKDTLRVNTSSSEGQTGEWLLDPVDFTIAASGGDITGAALSAALQSNNVTIQTLASSVTCTNATCGTGNASGNGDIHVNDSITATGSMRTLTLQASRDINVNKAVKVDGLNLTAVGNVNVNDVVDVGSSLTVNYGASVSGSTFTPNTGVRLSDISSLNMKMTLDGFIGKINLGALANSAVINGNNYIIIKDRDGLLTISNNTASLANRYILANDIDLGASWTPIGIGVTGFSGSFEGLGHLAKNLNVTTPLSGFSGFFNAITNSASISNLGVVGDVSVSSGTAGGLVGTTGSAVDILLRNVYSKVNVSTAGTGSSNAGGLLGNATNGTLITNAIIVGQTVKSSSSSAGGVVGSFSAISGTRAKNVFSTANVEGAINAGGLFGAIVNNSTSGSVNISNVYATGNVIGGNTANTRAGGLIGQANSNGVSSAIIIDNAFASGKVSTIAANALRGGLVGFIGSAAGANISISNAYWDSAKSEQSAVSGSTVGLTTTNVNDVRIGNPATLFPNLNSDTWAVVNGTPTLKVFQSAPSIQQVFIRLACGTLCFNTYGNELPTFVFDDFAAANGTTPLTNATLTGTATFNVTDANNNAVTGFNSLSNAGTYKFVYTGGLMASGFELVAGDAVTWTVVPRTLTATLQGTTANPLTKTYDGNKALVLTSQNLQLGNFVGTQGAGASLTGVTSGTYNSKNVSEATTLTANLASAQLQLGDGIKASNYQFAETAQGAATITKRDITVGAATVANRVYNGNALTRVTAGALSTLVEGEDLLVSAEGSFNDRHVGIGKTVTTTTTLSNGENGLASNYALTNATGTATANITAKEITAITGITANDKTYDGKTTAELNTSHVGFTGMIEEDTLTVATATGNFQGKDAAQNKTVDITTLSLGGDDASNYTLVTTTATTTATITPKALSVLGSTVADRDYNGTTAATVTVGQLSGFVGNETLGRTTATGTFASKDALANQNVTVAYALSNDTGSSGGLASNYSLANEVKTATINKKALTILGSTVTTKTYNGSNSATITAGNLDGLVEGETLGVTTATGTFDTKDAGSNKDVTVAYTLNNGASIITTREETILNLCPQMPCTPPTTTFTVITETPGAKASNYSLAGETLKGSITPKALTVSGIIALGKAYDGNTTATLLNQGSVATGISGESLVVSSTGVFNNQNAGDRTVNTTSTLGNGVGGLASNYSLSNVSNSFDATIAKKALLVSGIVASNKTYNGKFDATLSNQGTVSTGISGEALTVTSTGLFTNKNAGERTVNTLSALGNGTGGLASNYSLSNSEGTVSATIDQAKLTISGITAANKAYDGTRTATVNTANVVRSGLVSGDDVTVTATGVFADKNANNGKTVALTSTYGGTDLGNYTITGQSSTTANITKRNITVGAPTAANKAYDGLTAAKVTAGALSNMVAGESLVVSATGYFANAEVGNGKTVTTKTSIANGTNGLASNYNLTNAAGTTTANITKANYVTIGAAANSMLVLSKPAVAEKKLAAK